MATDKNGKSADVYRRMTPSERRKVAAVRRHVEANLPQLLAKGRSARLHHDVLRNAVRLLREARLAKGMSLGDVARASGIDKARLSRLENDDHPNPTLDTLTRIADAMHAHLSIVLTDKVA